MRDQDINLLPKREKKVAGKLLYFLLHYFRYVIVITQIVVIGVFFYRFSADQEIIDLKESFKQKQQILTITLPLVQEAEAIQRRTLQAENLLTKQDSFIQQLDYIFTIIPNDVILISLDAGTNAVKIGGRSETLLSIRSLNHRLQERKEFSNAQIVSVERVNEGGFIFSIVVDLIQHVKEG
ncbi:hypothetical protein A3H80_02690 [Candidatus Roizmanbacteria bacterium RIFCSPLOWO2_02_FULL_37_19]|uniref:Fimbrial assembly protein n=1 Tax=Candidatus Roizmanbacteria bacterium RIFCSPHIGHO2_02_FULL_37_24 TaxID=1802037 RepID=A0A1F7GZ08_9BACT|nr:MAG: hypothetical protein A2862_00885 [Candidatus Roizmanbacteria bacterium RIFCSPHIGHO2_01_FULL_38_41]OGK24330.1 MAG: hypothetical protein A3C24_02205 [Candidatus Roizmanbacteria bacterium RIFCSPHIGHO2_02_FULL_37_24]OGK32088.1 MAG: hypothetical protein A3E10_00405 [Candidatus Roizmanbacteria bacterium RIFCSPHIGHO2_12_FULL_37_23]OGK44933.1 MAG: hypothetical protein A2956_04995 [Candidatus Roizmanbacteria bacterium RIFCSPLOWO2_01_FULL_37_57]OGK53768.1 MAG: hypothetical protein A3H80_02690 [Ca